MFLLLIVEVSQQSKPRVSDFGTKQLSVTGERMCTYYIFLLSPSQERTIYLIIPKLLTGKKRYVNGASEEDVAF